jgi:hypothetical protein
MHERGESMSYLRLVATAIIAVCGIMAITTTAAYAEAPALITYSGSGAFTITSGPGKLETTGGLEISCKAANGTGQLGGKGGSAEALTAALTSTMTGCETLGKKCTSAGLSAGNVQTVPLIAVLGRISPGIAGALLLPKTGEQYVVPVKCGEVEFKGHGGGIGEITTAVDKQSKSLTIVSRQTAGVQAIKKFEGETASHTPIVEIGGTPEEAGIEGTAILTLKEGSGILLA